MSNRINKADEWQLTRFRRPGSGGRREGAGKKSYYGERTINVRIPLSKRDEVRLWLSQFRVNRSGENKSV